MMIWGTPVTALEFFGYGIALAGLLYYKLGTEHLKQYAGGAGRSWSEFGQQKPAMRKLVVSGTLLVTVLILVGGLAPRFALEQAKSLREILGSPSPHN